MSTGADLRRIALSLEGTNEAPHFDRAAFKVRRIYVTLAHDEKTANFMFTPEQQEFKCIIGTKKELAHENKPCTYCFYRGARKTAIAERMRPVREGRWL
jgi:hypothetical protein